MKKGVLIGGGVAVALIVQIALALFFFSGGDAEPEPADTVAEPSRAIYHNLRPPFVVTLPSGDRHYMMQADLAVMAYDRSAIEGVIRHAPLIRAEVITFLTDLDPEAVQEKDGKQEMLDALAGVINGALEREREQASIDSVLFNNLVMQ